MAYNLNPSTDNCYPGTLVLVNKLDIHDQKQLDTNEALIAASQALQLELSPPTGAFSFDYYKNLHQALFEDLYDWAGTVRTIDMSKGQTSFCPVAQIEATGKGFFARLATDCYLCGMARKKLPRKLAEYYADLNYIHPFREGNGRVQRLFFRLLAAQAGFELNYTNTDSDLLMIATIHAASGVMDTLTQVFEEILEF